MTKHELDLEVAGLLPAREEMVRIRVNVADIRADNFSLAANVASRKSFAGSYASQSIKVVQL